MRNLEEAMAEMNTRHSDVFADSPDQTDDLKRMHSLAQISNEADDLRRELVKRAGAIEALQRKVIMQTAELDTISQENWLLASKVNLLKLRLDAVRDEARQNADSRAIFPDEKGMTPND